MKKSYGYSLLELSLVLLIGTFLTVTIYTKFFSNNDAKRHFLTREKITILQEKLLEYLSENGRLPCPSQPQLAPTHADFGYEAVDTQVVATDPIFTGPGPYRCIVQNGVKSSTDGAAEVYQGAIPAYSLGLDGNFMYDGFGRQFSYVVTRAYINSIQTNSQCEAAMMITAPDTTPLDTPLAARETMMCFAAERGAINLHSSTLKLYNIYEVGGTNNTIDGISYIIISAGEKGGESEASIATKINRGCSELGLCHDAQILNDNIYVLSVNESAQVSFTDIIAFKARNNLVVDCNEKFTGKCSQTWKLDVR